MRGPPPLYVQPEAAGAPVTLLVASGVRSSTRPRRSPVRPVSVPLCARKEARVWSTRVQVCWWPVACTMRMTLIPQSWGSRAW